LIQYRRTGTSSPVIQTTAKATIATISALGYGATDQVGVIAYNKVKVNIKNSGASQYNYDVQLIGGV